MVSPCAPGLQRNSMSLPPRCVVDSCALEDLQVCRLLRPFLSATSAVIPDLLADEMRAGTWSQIQTWGAQIVGLAGDELREVIRLSQGRRALSPYDFATIVIARRENVPLLTSNFSHIPDAAGEHGVSVFGVLHVVEQIVSLAIVNPPAAASGLRAMLDGGSFLPWDECERLIRRWSSLTP